MQPALEPPRDELTEAEVASAIEADKVEVTPGLELLDTDDNLVEDISGDLLTGAVSRQNYADIHGTCRLSISRQLEWGRQRLRPYMIVEGDGVSARFNLGVFLPSTPTRTVGESPETYEVEGYDKLSILQTPIGRGWRISDGTSYLTAVRDLIDDAGETKVKLDPTSTATLPYDRAFPLDENTTYLSAINELLAAVNYRGLWVDWDGYFRSEPYIAPASRAPEWTYDSDDERTIVGEFRSEETDLFDVPNVWVFYITTALPGGALPVEGNGIYTVTNQSDGPASIDGRGGQAKRRVMGLDVPNHAALVARGDAIVAQDKQPTSKITLTTGPMPLVWHFDVALLRDEALPPSPRKLLSQGWTLPLDGSDMSQEFKAVA